MNKCWVVNRFVAHKYNLNGLRYRQQQNAIKVTILIINIINKIIGHYRKIIRNKTTILLIMNITQTTILQLYHQANQNQQQTGNTSIATI